MSNFPNTPISLTNTNIPIYLDTTHNRTAQEANEPAEHICPKCSASSRDQPIHCISVSPAPPPYHTLTARTPPPGRLAVPVLNLQTAVPPSERPYPHRPSPVFQTDEERARVRFRRNAISPVSPQISRHVPADSRHSRVGLGIPDAPFKPDTSPITPGTAEKANKESGENPQPLDESTTGPFGASHLAQRIEQKLWKYSASRNVVKRWLMEIISWTVSACCMTGIVIVLYLYRHQPLPHWPLGLTLNAYISVLAKISSAALLLPVSEALGQLKWNWFQAKKDETKQSKKMWDFELFDNASRGPWGSFMLLLRIKGRSLAALGAAITLFALAMDPFFQQVVAFPEQWRIQPTKGLISRAMAYIPYTAGTYLIGQNSVMELDQTMQATAYTYFYDNGTAPVLSSEGGGLAPAIPLTCPNRKCSWTKYETLGVCNRCADVRDRLRFACRHSALDWIQSPEALPDLSNWNYPNGTACGWFLETEDPILMAGYTTDRFTNHTGEVLVSRSQPLYDIFTRAPIPGYKAKLNDTRNPISHFVIVSGGDVTQVQQNATPIAHECILSWCALTMQSEVAQGIYSENITERKFNKTLGPNPWIYNQLVEDGQPLGVELFYKENVTIIGEGNHEYTISNLTHSNVISIFDDIFPSTYTVTNSTDMGKAVLRIQQYRTTDYRTRVGSYNAFLYNNITTHLNHLATDFTNIVRSAKSSTEMIQGPAFDLVSVVQVRWEWLSLPVGLLGFTLIFLVTTILRSSLTQDVGVWKTSAIATLLYGLPDDVRQKVTSVKDQGTPRANAKRTKIKWLPGTGWRLSGTSVFSPSSLKPRHTPPQPEWRGE